MPLKNDQIASAIKTGVPVKLADGHGLYLVVRRPGKAYWITQFRTGDRFSSKSLGPATSVTAAEARRRREAFAVGKRNRSLMTSAAVPIGALVGTSRQAPAVLAGKLFGEANATYRTNHAAEWSEREQVQIARLFKNHTGPLDGRPVGEITTDDVAAVLRPIWRGPGAGQGARLRQLMEHVFRAAKVTPNPATWEALQDVLSKKTIKAKAHASMPAEEVPAFIESASRAPDARRQ